MYLAWDEGEEEKEKKWGGVEKEGKGEEQSDRRKEEKNCRSI